MIVIVYFPKLQYNLITTLQKCMDPEFDFIWLKKREVNREVFEQMDAVEITPYMRAIFVLL